MVSVLLIDDDAALREVLSAYLTSHHHAVTSADGGAAGLSLLASSRPDIVVLDVTMPNMDGWQVLSRIREQSTVPVIMLTGRTDESDVLKGFGLGADDYVAKPFSFPQLVARIRAVLARSGRDAGASTPVLTGGDLRVDLDAHRVLRDGRTIKLTPTEFKLLVVLMEQPGRIFSPTHLVRKVWGPQYAAEGDYVRRYIWYLRKKVEADPDEPRHIKNERSVGYYFAP